MCLSTFFRPLSPEAFAVPKSFAVGDFGLPGVSRITLTQESPR